MSNLSSSPANFERFLNLQRGSSRSLSPENELRQMILAAAVPPADEGALAEPPPVAGAPPRGAVLETRRPSGPAGDAAETVGSSLLSSPLQEARLVAAQWQYGSPLYYPPTRTFYCWKLHPIHEATAATYADMDGVSCDFCGHTIWVEQGTMAGENPGGRRMVTRRQSKDEAGKHFPPFLHCNTCMMDLCAHCAEDIRRSERFHVPSLHCRRCDVYVSMDATAPHRCAEKIQVKEEADVKESRRASAPAQPLNPEKVVAKAPARPRAARQPPASHSAATPAGAHVPETAPPAPVPLAVVPPSPAAANSNTAAKPKRIHKSKEEQRRRAERRVVREAKRAAEAAAKQRRLAYRIARMEQRRRPVPDELRERLRALTAAAAAAPTAAPAAATASPTAPPAPPAPPVAKAHVPAQGKTASAVTKAPPRRTANAKRARPPLAAHEDNNDGSGTSGGAAEEPDEREPTPSRAEAEEIVSSTRLPPPSGWRVSVTFAGDDDKEEISRMAAELNLELYPSPAEKCVLFALPTRLAAEKCARRAHDAGLKTSLWRA